MDYVTEIMRNLIDLLKGLCGEQIALISVFVSFIIYILSKQTELKMKKHEAKKEHYQKLIEMLENIFLKTSITNAKELKMTEALRKEFFDLGSSLLFYGSTKMYRQYIFYRELSNNQLYKHKLSKYYDPEIAIYVLADMFLTIRKEIGLNTFDNVSSVESLAFFVNDVATNPFSKIKSFKAKHKIRMLKIEMFFIDQINLVLFIRIYYRYIAPAFSFIRLLVKYLFLIPLGKILIFIAPNVVEKLDNMMKKLEKHQNSK